MTLDGAVKKLALGLNEVSKGGADRTQKLASLQNEVLSPIGGKVLSKPLKSAFPGCNPTSYYDTVFFPDQW